MEGEREKGEDNGGREGKGRGQWRERGKRERTMEGEREKGEDGLRQMYRSKEGGRRKRGELMVTGSSNGLHGSSLSANLGVSEGLVARG